MTSAIPQRTVTISIRGSNQADASASYSYWSPTDGLMRWSANRCDLINRRATNTLFVLDYASTLDGWTMVETSPNPAGASALPFQAGPQGTSLLTIDSFHEMKTFAFYIHYKNTLTGAVVLIDPQEGNEPGNV